MLRAQNRCDEAIPEYETALALNRNWVTAYGHIGQCKISTGAIEEAIPLYERALRLSPRDPEIGNWYFRIGSAHLLQSRTDEAIFWLEKARAATPEPPQPHACLAAAYALKGETERATAELAEARRLSGEGSLFEHRSNEGPNYAGAGDPRLARGHLFRRPAQSRGAGGMTAASTLG